MIRLFNVYYPVRTVLLLLGEALVVGSCFLLAMGLMLGRATYLVLAYEYGLVKILSLTVLATMLSY